MDEKHKPCPFCGSKSISMQYGADLEPCGIFCGRCKALVRWPIQAKSRKETFGETMARWMEKWDQRGGT